MEYCDSLALYVDSCDGTRAKKVRKKMRREAGFLYKKTRDEYTSKHEIVESFMHDIEPHPFYRHPVTAIVASPGSGKTTLMREMAVDTLDSCTIFDYAAKRMSMESHLKMIYYKDMKNIKYRDQMKPSQFLFEGLYRNSSHEEDAYQWLLDHQTEAIFYFDGLDQASWSVNQQSARCIQPFEIATTSEILYNILSRNLLPYAKIVISSREYMISELPPDARPDEIVSLMGLSHRDAISHPIFSESPDQNVSEIFEILSPKLLNLLSNPSYLMLAAVVIKNQSYNITSITATELYHQIISHLHRFETIQERETKRNFITKLKPLAYQGIMEERLTFRESDLKRFGISFYLIRDLMMKVPGKNILSRYLEESDFEYLFCEQVFQEYLCASFVAEMRFRLFAWINDKYLHTARWRVVRSFVSGIIHDTSESQLHEGWFCYVYEL